MLDGMPTADTTASEAPASAEVTQDATGLQTEPEQIAEVAQTGPTEDADAFEEIEHDGAIHRIPKALKGAFLMQADYTRKTQELADQRRGFESEREMLGRAMQAQAAQTRELGRLHVLDETLAAYSQVDWAALRGQDPERANAMFQDYVQLRDQRDALAGHVQQALERESHEAQRTFAKRYVETNALLSRDIKGWNQDTANKVRDFALGNGITAEQLTVIATTPTLAKLLHKAWLGEQLVRKQEAAARAAAAGDGETRPEPKPVPKVGSKSSAVVRAGLHDDLPADEWLKRRNEQVRKRA
jgi:hypothetical protein